MNVRVAVAQLEHAPEPCGNLDAALAAIAEAGAAGAGIVAFPETFLPGYPAWLDVCRDASLWDHPAVKSAYRDHVAGALAVPGPELQRLQSAARDAEVVVVAGFVERVAEGAGHGTLYNALVTIGTHVITVCAPDTTDAGLVGKSGLGELLPIKARPREEVGDLRPDRELRGSPEHGVDVGVHLLHHGPRQVLA